MPLPISTIPVKAVLNFKNASILPTTSVIYDPRTDTLYAEVEVIQHCEGFGYPQGIRKERITLPNGVDLIRQIRERAE